MCDVCSKSFTSLTSLNRHNKVKHGHSGKFICDFCDGSFYNSTLLNNHKLLHITESKFPCDICQNLFKSIEHVERHKKTHVTIEDKNNSESTKKYLCTTCGKVLYSSSGYQTHLRMHIDDKKFKCDVYEKSFREKVQLKFHLVSHTDDRSAHLVSHQAVHVSDKNFACEICGVTTKYKSGLTHHMRNIHLGIREHTCDECDERFYTSSWLKH